MKETLSDAEVGKTINVLRGWRDDQAHARDLVPILEGWLKIATPAQHVVIAKALADYKAALEQ